jgi:hypothetical protein
MHLRAGNKQQHSTNIKGAVGEGEVTTTAAADDDARV